MRVRLLLALAFVAVVGALIALRDEGYLGGRVAGGPFRIGTALVSVEAERDQVAAFGLSGSLKGGPVRVQGVRPRLVSPGLEVLGPDLTARCAGACYFDHWPPPDSAGPLQDATVRDAVPRALIGLRAQRPGVYYALGLTVDYRRGQRRYRDREAQRLCIEVQTRAECDLSYRGPGRARVAQVGGPSRYAGARLTERDAIYRRPGDYTVRLTVANQTGSAIKVSDLALDANEAGAAIVETAPDSFRLEPHGDESVRMQLSVPACRRVGGRFGRLRAKLDGERRSIPLSLPLRFAC